MNKLILPGKGRKYSGSRSKGLVWLRNSRGWHFPNHYIRKNSKTVLLYSHGNGGTLGDFKHIVSFYAEWYATIPSVDVALLTTFPQLAITFIIYSI